MCALTTGCDPADDRHPNRLINSTSPYLLQHAYNPVDWFEWSEEALEKARKEDKPLLVSIGYSSCHWCHVMEHESFEDKDIAELMNENFVCIKVDREERPDIDQVYMEAVQAMGINGGWPLNVFITPDQKPFYGGTYFPPKNWAQMLIQIAKVYKEKREDITQSANELARHLAASDLDKFRKANNPAEFKKEALPRMFDTLTSIFDNQWGGIDKAPKFVMPTQWLFLLRYYATTKNKDALDMVELTLKKMAMGGLYDQVGGGFARYSVDNRWFAPHFEKMLYDNAQLLSLYSEAYTATKDNLYKEIVYETVDWLTREMISEDGGFYSALDADSEGEEGKYYVWAKNEFDSLLGDKPEWLDSYYSLTDSGNWEHGNNILFIEKTNEEFAKANKITIDEIEATKKKIKPILLAAREKRIRPGLDDKVLTGWNAMMIKGLLDAYSAFNDKAFLSLAIKTISFLEKNSIKDKVYRSFKEKHSTVEGFLEDYAFLIQAYTALYQATFDEGYLKKAASWLDYTNAHFYDEKEGYYHFSGNNAEQLIAKKKEIFDNVIPSSNGVMARNLLHLGILLDRSDYVSRSEKMVSQISHLIQSEPTYMSHWAIVYSELANDLAEIVFVGKNPTLAANTLRQNYIPFSLYMGTSNSSELPLIKDKVNPDGNDLTIYVCFNKTCKRPVHTAEEALTQLP